MKALERRYRAANGYMKYIIESVDSEPVFK